MLNQTSRLIAIAALNLTIGTNGAGAAPVVHQKASAELNQTMTHLIGRDRRPVRRIVSASRSAGEKCGVWRCTWPTSGGGCLVWEKTLCKIKTIDPFE